MAFASSLALDPTFGLHSHKTLDTAQPFQIENFPLLTVPSSQLTSVPSFCYSHGVCVRVCVCVCVCVCV